MKGVKPNNLTDNKNSRIVKRPRPIYWQHAESECVGVIYSLTTLEQMVRTDPCVDVNIPKKLYLQRIKEGWDYE